MIPDIRQGLTLLGNRQAVVQPFGLPALKADELLLRTCAAGICGSDLHFYRSTPEELGVRRGVIIGHEPSGIVAAVGSGVRNFQPGDRITVNHTLGCGHCAYCSAGEPTLCAENQGLAAAGYGGDADYVILPARTCFHLPSELSFIEGAFIACTGATAYSALRKLAPSGRTTLAIFGLGPVGLSAVIVGKALGARVVALDLLPARLDLAKALGADDAINVAHEDAAAALSALTDGRGVELALETSGAAAGQSAAVDALRPKGKAAFVGLSDGRKSISPEQFLHKEAVLFGSKVMPAPLYWELTRFMIERNVRFEPIVTQRMALVDGPEAFARFAAGAEGKFILLPHGAC